MARDHFSDGPTAPDPVKALHGALEYIKKLEAERVEPPAPPDLRGLPEKHDNKEM